MNQAERKEAEAQIRERYAALEPNLNERARRLFVAAEARTLGHGGVAAAVRATGMAQSTISRGILELNAIDAGEEPLKVTRSRRKGAGRKKVEDKYPELMPSLKHLAESTTRGDPESPLLWTARSLRNITQELNSQGFPVGKSTLSRLLRKLGYSLQANAKRMEGKQHPDRNAQFEHINESIREQSAKGNPVISVDTKKKELVGNYKNAGKELRPTQDPEHVDAYDFIGPGGKVAPYGVYDLAANEAWVNVGISSDTAEFAVASVRYWWHEMGAPLYPDASSLLITADCGGSNGYRVRLWKVELQKLADEMGIPITVCHLPPGTSKWNKIEHKLFSFISQNWRGKPLVSHKVIVNLIAATTTDAGLKVRARLDRHEYKKGIRISDAKFADVHLVPDKFHGEWNYTIIPAVDA